MAFKTIVPMIINVYVIKIMFKISFFIKFSQKPQTKKPLNIVFNQFSVKICDKLFNHDIDHRYDKLLNKKLHCTVTVRNWN